MEVGRLDVKLKEEGEKGKEEEKGEESYYTP